MSSYQKRITEVLESMGRPEVNTRWVEAWMRSVLGTLDWPDRARFTREVKKAVKIIDSMDDDSHNEAFAASYGLGAADTDTTHTTSEDTTMTKQSTTTSKTAKAVKTTKGTDVVEAGRAPEGTKFVAGIANILAGTQTADEVIADLLPDAKPESKGAKKAKELKAQVAAGSRKPGKGGKATAEVIAARPADEPTPKPAAKKEEKAKPAATAGSKVMPAGKTVAEQLLALQAKGVPATSHTIIMEVAGGKPLSLSGMALNGAVCQLKMRGLLEKGIKEPKLTALGMAYTSGTAGQKAGKPAGGSKRAAK